MSETGNFVKNIVYPQRASLLTISNNYLFLSLDFTDYYYTLLNVYDLNMNLLTSLRFNDYLGRTLFDATSNRLYIDYRGIYSLDFVNGNYSLKLINNSYLGISQTSKLLDNEIYYYSSNYIYLTNLITRRYQSYRTAFCRGNTFLSDSIGNVMFKCTGPEYGIVDIRNNFTETIYIIPNNSVINFSSGSYYFDSKGRFIHVYQKTDSNYYNYFTKMVLDFYC